MSGSGFGQDMRQMVDRAVVPESKKSLAREYLRQCDEIANGAAGDLSMISRALLAQTPILLELYLSSPERAIEEAVELAVAEHARVCRELAVGHGAGDLNWKRLVAETLIHMGWPGATVTVVYLLRPLIEFLVKG